MTENIRKRYAINDRKQAELDALTAKVLRAQYKVDQLKAIVDSLTTKKGVYDADLATATTDRDTALSNLNMVKEVVSEIEEMVRQTEIVQVQTGKANDETAKAAEQLSIMVNQLIFSVELIDKLQLMITKKQETRAIISADLVTTVNTAASDANSAISLTLTALNSCYIAMASGAEANSLTHLEYAQSLDLYGLITGHYRVIDGALVASAALEKETKNLQHKEIEVLNAAREAGKTQLFDGVHLTESKLKELISIIKDDKKTHETTVNNTAGAFDDAAKAYQEAVGRKTRDAKLESQLIAQLSHAQVRSDDAQIKHEALETLVQGLDKLVECFTKVNTARQAVNASQHALAVEFSNFTSIEPKGNSLYKLLIDANNRALAHYNFAYQADQLVNRELIQANANLANATVELDSLKAGLAAATAAALAA